MGRKKAKQQLIENVASRKVTFTKRVSGVVRKTEELSVLCGVDACCVIYGPYSQAPIVWPSCKKEAKRVLTNFKQKSEVDQTKRQLDQVGYLKESIKKAEEKLLRIRKKNREMEMENIITEVIRGRMAYEDVPHAALGDLLWVLQHKLRGIEHRLTVQANNNNVSFASMDQSEEDYGLSTIVDQCLTIKQKTHA